MNVIVNGFIITIIFRVFASRAEERNCWWSDCQSLEVSNHDCGAGYKLIQENSCDGGKTFFCCASNTKRKKRDTGQETCWWTGCQSPTLAIGCPDYGRLMKKKRSCDIGEDFYCCIDNQQRAFTNKPVMPPQVEGSVWSTKCIPIDWEVRGCRMDHEVGRQSCSNKTWLGDAFFCLQKSEVVPKPTVAPTVHISMAISVSNKRP